MSSLSWEEDSSQRVLKILYFYDLRQYKIHFQKLDIIFEKLVFIYIEKVQSEIEVFK